MEYFAKSSQKTSKQKFKYFTYNFYLFANNNYGGVKWHKT